MELRSMKATKSQIYEFVKSTKAYEKLNPNWKVLIGHLDWPRATFWHVKLACETANLILPGKGGPRVRIQLARNGELLHDAIREGPEEADSVLAKILLSLDLKGWKIAETVRSIAEAPEGTVSVDRLRTELAREEVRVSPTTLRDFLNILRELKVVKFETAEKVRIIMRGYQRILGTRLYREPSDRKFFNALSAAYLTLLPRAHGSRYIPIPDVKSIVCKRVSLDIPEYVFDEKLEQLPLDFAGKRIDLSPPMNRVAGGVKRGKDYFYYIAIYD
jgi:hypothetical protein